MIQHIPPHDITVVLTDANASISALDGNNPNTPIDTAVTGTTFIDERTNDNGNRLLLLCQSHNLCITDTWFPRKRIHHWTWYSADGRTRKGIDHILISRRWRSSVTNCRVFRGAQLGNTDHRMLVAQLKLRLKADPTTKHQPRLDSTRLLDPVMASSYHCTISNRYLGWPQ